MRAIQFQNKRVGSTFLQNAINSHPDIMGIDEVFVNMARKPGMRKSGFVPYLRSDIHNPGEYIEEIIYRTYENKSTIFKLMYNQIGYHSGLMAYIEKHKIPMIHLMRRNLVKQVISGMTADTIKHNPVRITGQELLNAVKEAHKANKYWADRLKDHIKLTLYYEDIIGQGENDRTYMSNDTSIEVCNFFGAAQYRLFSKTKKKNKDDISVYLPNLNQIKQVFEGGKFEWMLQ